MLSAGRHHGVESLEEQRFLLAPDFAGGVTGAVPLRLLAAAELRAPPGVRRVAGGGRGCAVAIAP